MPPPRDPQDPGSGEFADEPEGLSMPPQAPQAAHGERRRRVSFFGVGRQKAQEAAARAADQAERDQLRQRLALRQAYRDVGGDPDAQASDFQRWAQGQAAAEARARGDAPIPPPAAPVSPTAAHPAAGQPAPGWTGPAHPPTQAWGAPPGQAELGYTQLPQGYVPVHGYSSPGPYPAAPQAPQAPHADLGQMPAGAYSQGVPTAHQPPPSHPGSHAGGHVSGQAGWGTPPPPPAPPGYGPSGHGPEGHGSQNHGPQARGPQGPWGTPPALQPSGASRAGFGPPLGRPCEIELGADARGVVIQGTLEQVTGDWITVRDHFATLHWIARSQVIEIRLR